jgi:transposase InsO family protein
MKRRIDGRSKPKITPPGKSKRGRKEGGGTAIIEKLLRDNGGEMGSGELAEAAKDQGVKYPHSSFQSLKKRGRIKLEDHVVHLIEE